MSQNRKFSLPNSVDDIDDDGPVRSDNEEFVTGGDPSLLSPSGGNTPGNLTAGHKKPKADFSVGIGRVMEVAPDFVEDAVDKAAIDRELEGSELDRSKLERQIREDYKAQGFEKFYSEEEFERLVERALDSAFPSPEFPDADDPEENEMARRMRDKDEKANVERMLSQRHAQDKPMDISITNDQQQNKSQSSGVGSFGLFSNKAKDDVQPIANPSAQQKYKKS